MSDNFEEKDGVWRTVSGRRIFIREGESLTDAMKRSGKFNNSESHARKRFNKLKEIKNAEPDESDNGEQITIYANNSRDMDKIDDELTGRDDPLDLEITQEILDKSPVYLESIYEINGERASTYYIFPNLKTLEEKIRKEYGGFSQFDGKLNEDYFIKSAIGDGKDYYLVRNKYYKNGRAWQDANGENVKGQEWRKIGGDSTSSKSYDDLDSDEKKKFRRWYRKHAEELAQKYKDSDDVRKAAQDEWLLDHSSSENSEKVTNKTKEISDKIKEQRQSQEVKQAQDDNIQHDYSQGHWDSETKSYVLDDGHKVEMLPKKEYKKLSQEQYENSSEDTKEIVDAYTISQATAGSCDLNRITPEALEKGERLTQRGIFNEPGFIMSQRERDMLDDEMYEDWVKNYEPKTKNADWSTERKLKEEWKKRWDLDESDIFPNDLKPSTYSDDVDPKTGKRIYWTKEEMEEAKAVAKELRKLEDIKYRYDYGTPEYEQAQKEWKEVIDAIQNERLKIDNRSAYWYDEIAKYDETMVPKRGLNWDKLEKEGKIQYFNTQEQIDLNLNDHLKSMQCTDTLQRISGLKSGVKQFDEAFEKDGIGLDHDIMVYRRSYENSKEMDEGYTKLGYTSTSAQDTLPKKMPSGVSFGEIEQYIIIPKGTKVLFAEDIIGYGHKKNTQNYAERYEKADNGLRRQHEIILPRGTSFKKVGTVTENGWNTRAYILKADVKEEYKNGKRN